MRLIDQRLEADLAELDEELSCSHNEEGSENRSQNIQIEQWLNRGQQELEDWPQPAPIIENSTGREQPQSPPAPVVAVRSDTDTVLLANAIKELAAAATHGSNFQLLSRLSTPRDLPFFSGDPMEWLHFKQAYDESTLVCNFTEKENLWRLRKCLTGAAKEAVTSLLISASSPTIIMSTLELQFGNPDIILNRIMQDIGYKLQPMSSDYFKDIVPFAIKVQNYVAAVIAIGHDDYLRGFNVISMLLSKLPTVLLSKWADYSYTSSSGNEKPKLVIFSEFLSEEAAKISKASIAFSNQSYLNKSFRQQNSFNRMQTNRTQHNILVQNDCSSIIADEKCGFCKISIHKLTNCKKFLKSLRKNRWNYVKRHNICRKCLISRHNRENCPAGVCDVDDCGLPHHRLLHYPVRNRQSFENEITVIQPVEQLEPETVTHVSTTNCKVLLKTVALTIHGPYGTANIVALLDDGSTVSLINSSLASQLGLQGTKQVMRIHGAWNAIECESEILTFDVSNKDGEIFSLNARSSKELNLPIQNIQMKNLPNSNFCNSIKDQLCIGQCKPDILIGQDNYHLMLPLQIIKGKQDEAFLTRSPLGWCVHGLIRTPLNYCAKISSGSAFFMMEDSQQSIENNRTLHEISEQVRLSFKIDSLGVSTKPRQNSEHLKALQYLDKTSVLKNGRWYVGLPWKDVNCKLPDSFPAAMKRLQCVERKMKSDTGYAERYVERVQHLLNNDYAQKMKDEQQPSKIWYLPHFGVDNPNKKKLRLVFDAAAKVSGSSLNDFLLSGPDLLMSLFGIMLRFREYKIAIVGDIKDMFLRIKILPHDQHALRFLWRDLPKDTKSTQNPEITYVMTSLIFGANCSPFIAQFIKNKNAHRFQSSMPQAVHAIEKQHYMDDYIQSLPDEQSAIKLAAEVAHIHSQGGFEIRNWMSNSQSVLESFPIDSLASSAQKLKVGQDNEYERALGLLWFPKEDVLGFDVSFKKIPSHLVNGLKKPTKREILQVVMSIFDVYGFLSPFTIKGKIILQRTWKLELDWDDIVPDSIFDKWSDWLKQLKFIQNIRLPRHYEAQLHRVKSDESEITPLHSEITPSHPLTSLSSTAENNSDQFNAAILIKPTEFLPLKSTSLNYNDLQLHVFCDSSTQAMCAVAYWRWLTRNGKPQVAFVCSKCKVAPYKYMSVPRLELQAAVMAARLANTIIKEHSIVAGKHFFWSDSSTVLHWIRNTARNYKQFVAHRLGELDELTQVDEWRYVPTKQNVADIATRDSCESSVFSGEWFHGPEFLYKQSEAWPSGCHLGVRDVDLEFVNVLSLNCHLPSVPDSNRFSSWIRLLRSTCRVLMFIDKCKRLTVELDGDMMRRAENLLILYSQAQSFREDLEHLRRNLPLEKKSKLLTLSPVLDDLGILRVGGRIDAAPVVSAEFKHPVILDGNNQITKLLVRHYHVKFAHGNQETVVNELKQRFWIIRLRPTVKHVVSKCMICKIKRAQPQPPLMGDLPLARMSHHQRVFTFCGVDLFGPMEVTIGRRREKRYGVLFTCLTIRAIHIELVHALSTDSLIMAMRRMAARRGWPQHMFSDNGTNLRGADTELRRSVQALKQEALVGECANYGTTWTFIPPSSPHWGGAWERMIRSVKGCLKVVLRERAPRDEVLMTLMAEVEQIINSRPLTHVNVESGSNESLTPNHFLLGSSSNLPHLGVFDESDMYLRKHWRFSQRLADLFWRRWVKEVLPEMRPRKKWHSEQRPLKVGDLVLIADPNSPRNVWPRGAIVKVMPGKDGRVRVVQIKTKSGLLQRSAARVARIPTD